MSVKNRALRLARAVMPSALYEEGLPRLSYRHPGVKLLPSGGALRYFIEKPNLDPIEAYRSNIRLVQGVTQQEAAETFLSEFRWGRRPMLGLLAKDAPHVFATLATIGEDSPIYVVIRRPGERSFIRLAKHMDLERTFASGDRFTILQFLRDESSGRRYGQAFGCDLEVWEEDASGTLTTLAAGAPEIPAESRRQPIEVEPFYLPMYTYAPLNRPKLFAVNFPIDAVVMWVDGEDPQWLERQRARRAELGFAVEEEAIAAARFRQFDELRYALRSIERYGPWIRNIYLVTDGQRPSWLNEQGTNLRVVDHTEIFPESALPTFNSHALTASIHRIPGLADRFILFNDDIFLGRPVGPGRFFKSNRETRFFMSKSRIEDGPDTDLKASRVHTVDLIEKATGVRPTNLMKHTPVAFNRSFLEELSVEFSEEWERTVNNPFRTASDIVPSLMHHYIGYDRRYTTPGDIAYGYFGFGTELAFEAIERYRSGTSAEVVCVNDVGTDLDRVPDGAPTVESFLEGELPWKSSYEV